MSLDEIQALNLEVHNLIEYGGGPSGWDGTESALVEWGSGDCSHFVELLSRRLDFADIPHAVVGTVGDTVIHSVVVFRLGEADYVADPTVGVLYEYSFAELSREPSLALNHKGTVPENLSAYAGPQYFSQINRMASNPVIGAGSISIWSKHFMDRGDIVLGWRPSLVPSYVSVQSSLDGQVLVDGRDFQLDKNSIRYYPVGPGWSGEMKFSSELIARQAKIGLVSDYSTPLAPQRVFLGFEGGRAQIDRVSLLREEEVFFAVDFGVAESEQRDGVFVYADGTGTWGEVVEGNARNYRVHDSSIDSQFSHSVFYLRPGASVLELNGSTVIEVCYRELNRSFGEVNMKVLNLSEGVYQIVGTLPPGNERQCSSFPIPSSLLQNAWLEQ